MPTVGETKTKLVKTSRDKFLRHIVDFWNKDTVGKIIAFFLFVYVYLPFRIIKFFFKLIFLPLTILLSPLRPKKKRCPKCDSNEIKEVKPTSSQKALPGSLALLIGPVGLLAPRAKTLNVCRSCGFSWEDR